MDIVLFYQMKSLHIIIEDAFFLKTIDTAEETGTNKLFLNWTIFARKSIVCTQIFWEDFVFQFCYEMYSFFFEYFGIINANI